MGTVIRHPTSCNGKTIRYQWVAEMCGNKRTEADVISVLIGYTESAYMNKKQGQHGWEWISLSIPYLMALTTESRRTVQRALKWLKEHDLVSVRGPSGDATKKSYRLNLELLSKVSEARDKEGGPVHLVRYAGVREVSIVPGIPEKR